MTFALGLAAVIVGADLVIAGVTKRPFTRLLLGYWDAPGSSSTGAEVPTGANTSGNALTGGAYAPRGGNALTVLERQRTAQQARF